MRRALILVLVTFVWAGCKPNPPPPQASVPAAMRGSMRVVPGKVLSEAEFIPSLQATGAKFVVVTVFAADCGPCLTETLELVDRRSEWRRRGVEILGLGMGKTPDDVKKFYSQTGDRATFPLYFAPWFAEREKVEATPTLFIYSSSGKRLFRADGMEGENLLKLAQVELDRLLVDGR